MLRRDGGISAGLPPCVALRCPFGKPRPVLGGYAEVFLVATAAVSARHYVNLSLSLHVYIYIYIDSLNRRSANAMQVASDAGLRTLRTGARHTFARCRMTPAATAKRLRGVPCQSYQGPSTHLIYPFGGVAVPGVAGLGYVSVCDPEPFRKVPPDGR